MKGRWTRLSWTAGSIAAHVAAIALLTARPRPERPPIEVFIASGPIARGPRGLAPPPRAAPAPARSSTGPARRSAARRGVPVPRTVPDALPPATVEVAPVDADEVLPLGGTTFAGEGGAALATGGAGGGGRLGSGVGRDVDPGPLWLRRNVLRKIQRQVDRDPYPRVAELMGWRGTVRVGFTIRIDGSVFDVRVVSTSGHEVLDRAALRAVEVSAPYDPPPEEQAVIVPIVWFLPV